MRAGKIVVLNGPSSVGKTTVAAAARDLVGSECVAVSIDQFFSCVHPDRGIDWALFESLTRALFASALSFSKSGFHVVIDTVFEREACIDICLESLADVEVLFVGLTCPIEVLEEREILRGNRARGLARRQALHVHEGCRYDRMLDTSASCVVACAEAIRDLLLMAPPATPQRMGRLR